MKRAYRNTILRCFSICAPILFSWHSSFGQPRFPSLHLIYLVRDPCALRGLLRLPVLPHQRVMAVLEDFIFWRPFHGQMLRNTLPHHDIHPVFPPHRPRCSGERHL